MHTRYHILEHLGTGGMGDVSRAYDRLTGQYVALKRVTLSSSDLPDDHLRLTLTHEFKTLASLRHPNIIKVLDYGFDAAGLPYYTMEYLEGHTSILQAAETLAEDDKIDLLTQLLQGLDYLHRRGLLHRDLKPSNVLVTDGVVRVIDFGLATDTEHLSELAGTFAYMPPEIFTGMGSSVETDLYGVGLIAYSVLTGVHPYNLEQTPRDLISDILNLQPDFSDIPEYLHPVLSRLLAKMPDDRYQSAADAIRAIHQIYDRTIPLHKSAMLDSHLQSISFVGRQKQLNLLENALSALKSQAGSAWLVGGESGVGKSRLLEEIRIKALVEGVPVLVGQAIDGGGVPYQLWINILPHLLLGTEVSDFEAAILKPIVPRVSDILGRDIGELSGDYDGQFLIHETILNLFRRHEGPLLLLLEDLHWADLELLQRLLEIAPDLPLMIVGSYRDDDKPSLPSELAPMTYIKLERLSPDAVAEISRAMIGDAGERPGVLELLQNETEGNAFFIVEAVRTLVEEAGDLYTVGHKTLPASIMTYGIEAILTRRLQRIPTYYDELLEIAAVNGRFFEVNILRAVDEYQTDDFLQAGIDAAVIEVVDDKYRFAHDKLREKVLGELPLQLKAQHHQTIADTLCGIYPDNLPDHAVEIAQHYETAYQNGIQGIENRVGQFLILAGKYLAATFENTLAIDYFSRALEFLTDLQQRFDALSERSSVFALIGNRDAQAEDLSGMTALAKQADQHAQVHLNWAYYYFDMSDYPQVIEHAQAAVENARTVGDTILEAQALALWALTINSLGKVDQAFGLIEQARNLVEDTDDRRTRARVYGVLSRIWQERDNFELEEFYLYEASTIYEQLGDLRGQAHSLNALAYIVSRQGDYERQYNCFTRALELFRQIGDKDWETNLLGNLGVWHTERGEIDVARPYFVDALALAHQLGDDDAVAWTLLEQGNLFFAEGNYSQAAYNFEQGRIMYKALARTIPHAYAVIAAGLLSIRTGQFEKGLADLDRAKSFQSPIIDWYRLTGYAEHALLTGELNTALDFLNQAENIAATQSLYQEACLSQYLAVTLTRLEQTGLATQHAEQARLQFKKGGRLPHMIEALATLIGLGRDNYIDEVMDFLREHPLINGAHYPFRVYSILCEKLAEKGDKRSTDVLAKAHKQLMAVAGNIDDSEARQQFLTNIPYHQKILAAIES